MYFPSRVQLLCGKVANGQSIVPLFQLLPEVGVDEVQLSPEAANAFASNPSAAEDSDLLIYKDAAGASNDSAIREKIQQALNAAASAKLTNAVTQDANGNPVRDPAMPRQRQIHGSR